MKAMMKSLNYKKNTVHVLEGSEKIIGPFFGKKAPLTVRDSIADPHVLEKLLRVADRSKLSVNTVQNILFRPVPPAPPFCPQRTG